MKDFIHQYEPTRKVTCALFPAQHNAVLYQDKKYNASAPTKIAFNSNVVSVN